MSPGDWGDSQIGDIKKVADSAAHPIASLLSGESFAPILIERSQSGPITLYKRGPASEYVSGVANAFDIQLSAAAN